ncbi:MAG: hypothetical protein RR554_05620 [Vagococcus sp.]|uniref:hypothetical protein n=1 Tax=Vagococcus sp. TaxID=1933889 RepID=UPI002FC84E65
MQSYLPSNHTHSKKFTLKEPLSILCIFFIGTGLGVLSKFLDEIPRGTLPLYLDILEIDRFLSRMSIWLLLALVITLFSKTPLKAAISVFFFYAGMIGSYYTYSATVLGIFPYHKVIYWIILTIISPFLAYLCWYTRENTRFGKILTIGVIAVMFYYTFTYKQPELSIASLLDILTFSLCLFLFKRPLNQIIYLTFISIFLSFTLSAFLLFN